ncbi:replication initiation protein [Thiofilum flexile]|uniref:replication initiation protein n=1 Tax=Thiofilum flexile TaxID=125627 RepID=UPI0003675228|nr:replication initiation protein [Thiofilum flexile]
MLVIPEYNENAIVKKGNDLIEARYKLSIGEQRLVLLLASQIHVDDEDFEDYEIRVQDFAEMFNLKTDKSLYEKVEEAAKELVGKRVFLKNGKEVEVTAWLSYVKYIHGSGTIQLRFDKSLKPYLLQLKKQFTQYKLNHVMSFKSSYSIRLYELLIKDAWVPKKNGKDRFEKTFTLEEYRNFLGIEKGKYPIFADLKKWVIEPPVREITDQTDLNIFEVRYIKTGRKITGLCFVVLIRSEAETSAQVAQLQLGETPTEQPETHPIIDSLMSYGFSFEKAKTYKNKYGIKQIERNIAYMLATEKNKPILNKAGYLSKAIEDDYGNVIGAQEQKKKEQVAQKKAEEERKQKEEREQERKREEEQAKKRKVFDEFFSLSEKVRKYIQAEFEAYLKEKKIFEAIIQRWSILKNEKELLMVEDVGYRFYKFIVENNFL